MELQSNLNRHNFTRVEIRERIRRYYALNISDVLQGALSLCDNYCNDHTHVRCIKARKRNEGG